MFERFSRGYYLGRLYVEPYDGAHVVMHEDEHERVNEQLYTDGEGVERLDRPLLMKVGRTHLPVHGAAGVPQRTLAIPDETLEATGVRNPPTLEEVLLAKRDVAEQFLSFDGEAAGV